MLSRATYHEEEDLTMEDDDERSWGVMAVVVNSTMSQENRDEGNVFLEEHYRGRFLEIGKYLSTLEKDQAWNEKQYREIRHQAYGYLLKDGHLWKRPKRSDGIPLRVIDNLETRQQVISEFHDTLWAGHRGVWATYMKIKERYWWKRLYQDVAEFVGSCTDCQLQSKIRHRDCLQPTYPLSMHFQWVFDLVIMPKGLWGIRYLVLAREELSNFVEGRALRSKSIALVCRFVLEDIFCRYGSIGRLRADRRELDAEEAQVFFSRYGVKLKLTTSYNLEGNGKSERGHPPVIQALVKACQKPIMPAEDVLPTWVALPWEDGVGREELLAMRIRQLERRPEDIEVAMERMRKARLKNKARFDKTHRLRPKQIREGDWVLVFDSSLENQHSTERKFARRWFGPYVVVDVHENATYSLRKLDGTPLRLPIAGKRVKVFKRRVNTQESDFHDKKDLGSISYEEEDEFEEDDADDEDG
ncbi:hypothetical protein R1sor_010059 [Riccia sorocarpa]|uniref:Integrase catalytic domain-containing protein n=1 Tax=Riccia sorocarpa TaxID=122646 RepID=A0ABD3HX05_9MARC